ncbi:MAG: MarR family transcriptional regulator [Erythrobacter sp.]
MTLHSSDPKFARSLGELSELAGRDRDALQVIAAQLEDIVDVMRSTASDNQAASHRGAILQPDTGQEASPSTFLNFATRNKTPDRNTTSDLHKTPNRKTYVAIARRIYAMRRERNAIFHQQELFGEPAWDILLDLYIAESEGRSVSVSSACIGSAAPPTTGLRWLGVLAAHGLTERTPDPEDQRRILVRLTPRAIEAMDRYLAQLSGAQ